MPYLIPYRTPLTPEQAERGFDYLLALQTGGSASVAGRAGVDPELAFILPRLGQDIVWPTTTLDAQADPRADSFAPNEVGCVLLSALRDWARDSPATAALGIARSIIRFTVNSIRDPTTRTPPTPWRRRATSSGSSTARGDTSVGVPRVRRTAQRRPRPRRPAGRTRRR